MLAFSAFAESPFSSLGGTVRFGSTTQEAIFSKVSAGVGTFTGEADLSANFVVSTLAFVLQSNGATFEFAFTQSADGVKIKPGVSSQDINFTQSANGIRKAVGVAPVSANFVQSANGEKLYEELVTEVESTRTILKDNYYRILPDTMEIMPDSSQNHYKKLLKEFSYINKPIRSDQNLLDENEMSRMLDKIGFSN